jgi:CHAT domain-containing protein
LDRALRFSDKYNWVDAKDLFTSSEEGFRAAGDPRNALYASIGRLRSTMEEASLPALSLELDRIVADPLLADDSQLRLFALIVKGDVDGELDPAAAIRDWTAVQQIAAKLGNRRWQNRANGELALQHFIEGDIAGAKTLLAGALLGAVTTGDKPAQARFMSAIGVGYALSRLYVEGLDYLDRSLKLASSDPEMGFQYNTLNGKITALNGVQKTEEALAVANEVIAHARAGHKNAKLCVALLSRAQLFRDQKDNQQALGSLSEAIDLAETGSFPRLLADVRFSLAEIYQAMGDLDKAEAIAEQAAEATRNSGDIYLIPDRLHTLATIKAAKGKYEEADGLLTKASDYVDSMLASSPSLRVKSALVPAMGDIFSDHAALALECFKDPVKAYFLVERARSRTLSDLIRAGSPTQAIADPELDRQLSALRLKIASAKSEADIRKIRDEMFFRELSRWTARSPGKQSLANRSLPEPVPLDQVRGKLQNDELVLEYVLHEPHSFCLVLNHKGITAAELPSGQKITGLVQQYLETLKKQQDPTALGKTLFAALLGKVPGLSSARRLTIIPDGQLHLLPFDALVTAQGDYVVMRTVLSTAPSVSALYALATATARTPHPQNFLGVGGVPYDQNVMKIVATRGYEADGLGNLPGSEDEVVAAAQLAGRVGHATVLIGSQATESAFKKADLESRSIIHLAVHGIPSTTQPDHAALIFLADPKAGEDGLLQPSEILQLHLNNPLVVLSACETGVGRLQGEDGVATLSRSFLLAGARAVISTLWPVDDTIAAFVMERFYQNLVSGKDAATALAIAKRDVVRNYGANALPYYWGAFILEGAANPR